MLQRIEAIDTSSVLMYLGLKFADGIVLFEWNAPGIQSEVTIVARLYSAVLSQ